jgi:hypothetical protein
VEKFSWLVTILFVVVLFLGGCNSVSTAISEEEIPPEELVPEPSSSPEEYWFPDNLRWLTEAEKDRVIEIALATRKALEWLQKESQYKTEIKWIALRPDPSGKDYSGYNKYEYETVETGIPVYSDDMIILNGDQKVAEVYPDVTIWFGEPIKWVVSVAIDLDEEKAVFIEDYPARNGPTIPEKSD